MQAEDFKKDFLDSVKASSAATGTGSCACFTENMADDLVDKQILTDFNPCYAVGEYKRKKYRVDGYAFDEYDGTMFLIASDYDGIEKRVLTKTSAEQTISRVLVLVDAAMNSDILDETEISSAKYDLIEQLQNVRSKIRKYQIFVFTDAEMSSRIRNIKIDDFEGIPVEAQIWDLNRLFEVCTAPEAESIEINFSDYGIVGIPCIEANVGADQRYKSYLGVIPGEVLAEIFGKYGSKLLEGNVRSFLSTKVAVNKKIRETIINAPEMFFAYNNGISVTAENVQIENKNGMNYIVSARDFQIINGGQTTASLYNAKRNNHADLSAVYVQMKLTEIDNTKTTAEEADDLVRSISRSSNSQNKVSDADFFASHPFHRQIEQISRVTFAPAIHGNQYETLWYYERARGSYLQEQLRLTKSQQTAFQMKNPKDQVIKKTDLAKVQNAWMGHPDIVSKGAQTNFVSFAKYVDEQWQNSSTQFNAEYYKQTVGLVLMYKYLQAYIPKQPWYEGGYRANIINYSVALFHRLILKEFPGRDLDFSLIWKKQELPDAVKESLNAVSEKVFYKITDENRPVINVTQWCKRAACWDGVQSLRVELPEELDNCLVTKFESNNTKRKSKKEQKVVDGINAQTEVVSLPAEHWKRLAVFAVHHDLVQKKTDEDALKMAVRIPEKIPNSVQSRHLIELEKRAREEGFKSEDD